MGGGPLASPLSASSYRPPLLSLWKPKCLSIFLNDSGSEIAFYKALFCLLKVCFHSDVHFCSQFCHHGSSMDSGLTKMLTGYELPNLLWKPGNGTHKAFPEDQGNYTTFSTLYHQEGRQSVNNTWFLRDTDLIDEENSRKMFLKIKDIPLTFVHSYFYPAIVTRLQIFFLFVMALRLNLGPNAC